MLEYTILYYTVLYCARIHYTILCCTVLEYTILYYAVLYRARMHCLILYMALTLVVQAGSKRASPAEMLSEIWSEFVRDFVFGFHICRV